MVISSITNFVSFFKINLLYLNLNLVTFILVCLVFLHISLPNIIHVNLLKINHNWSHLTLIKINKKVKIKINITSNIRYLLNYFKFIESI
jgi:hypothetical protein